MALRDTHETFVKYTVNGSIAQVRLNRPDRLNAASPEVIADLRAALEQAVADDVVVVVLSGEGRAFCAGHDLKAETLDPSSDAALENLHRLQDITRLLRGSNIISVAAVHGFAFGAGIEFALSCDFVVADKETVFGFPEVSVGLSVTGGISFLLPQAIGLPRAKELVMLGDRFGPDEALALGLINQVVEAGQSLPAAEVLAARLVGLPRTALSMAKEAFEQGVRAHVEDAMVVEIENGLRTAESSDAQLARANFAVKERNQA